MEKDLMALLVQRAKNKDEEAFSQLYSQYYKALYRAAYYILGKAEEAEDTVMDTVLDAYKGISALRTPEAFEGWIFKILYNKAKRRRGRILWTATTEIPETAEAKNAGEESIAENADLMEALATLSQEDRSIVVLSICEGYSSAEIGRIMSLNANTVRSRQMRALARLKSILEIKEGGGNYGRR